MVLTYKGRLPGVAVEKAPRQIENTLRMDVPGIVGFAERGPVDTPIMIEDIQQYRAVFGGDVFLARDKGVPFYAQLPRAVQAFFDNGGHRCYVVRVTGKTARANRFRIPGLVTWDRAEDPTGEVFADDMSDNLRTVERPAAWLGRWSDTVSISTRLRRRPLRPYRPWEALKLNFTSNDPKVPPSNTIELQVSLPNAHTVAVNDLVNLHFKDAGESQIFMRVLTTEQLGYGSYDSTEWQGVPVRLTGDISHIRAISSAFQLPLMKELESIQYGLWVDDHTDWYELPRPRSADLEVNIAQGDLYNFEFFIIQSAEQKAKHPDCCCLCDSHNTKEIYVILPIDAVNKDFDKDVLRLFYKNGLVIDFPVTAVKETGFPEGSDNPDRATLKISSDRLIFNRDSIKNVQFLDATGWSSMPMPSSGLIFSPGSRTQPYQLEFLTVDRLLGPNDLLRINLVDGTQFLFPVSSYDWQYLSNGQPKLILSSSLLLTEKIPTDLNADDLTQIDLLAFDLYTREGNTLIQNWTGLSFGKTETTFWEDRLARISQDETVRTAEDILQNRSVHLGLPPDRTGNEAIPFYLPLNMLERQPQRIDFEGALLDPPGTRGGKDGLDSFSPVELFLDPDFYRDDPEERLRPEEIAALANEKLYFLDPNISRAKQIPKKLHSLYEIDEVSLIAIPELGDRCWEPAKRIVKRVLPASTSNCGCGNRFYPCPPPFVPPPVQRELPFQKLRGERDALLRDSDFQSSLFRRLATLPILVPFEDDCGCDDEQMIVVHRALVNMCAARGDIIAILSLPQNYAVRDVLDWHQQITCPREKDSWDEATWNSFPLCPRDYLDERALSFAAVYHGWTTVREELTPELKPTRVIAPDGTMLGLIAARTLERGPGIAPANQSMHAVVGLKPDLTDAEWEVLFNKQINILRQRPGRFTVLSVHTLSLDALMMKLSIKRLTIFIRKLVLREGQRYVFESNTPRFRRAVQSLFERTMKRLLTQGALVGYYVDASDRLNTPQDVDAGRFTVEIKYAPTHPVEFITVVLLRSGESLLEVLER